VPGGGRQARFFLPPRRWMSLLTEKMCMR
jgi:hypothetical protein